MNPNYPYGPLDTSSSAIRLISILPGPANMRLCCELINADLSSAPTYHALSYTWGDNVASESIMLNGHDFGVTKNLMSALRALQTADKSTLCWVDAICINQSDVQERNHQVGQMRRVYEKANVVIVWLGKESDDSGLAISFARQLADVANSKPADEEAARKARLSIFNMGCLNKWEALDSLMNRPWWTRSWVVQEVAVSTNVHVVCGEDVVEWEVFPSAASVVRAFSEERRFFWEEAGRSMEQIMKYTVTSSFPTREDEDHSLKALLSQTWKKEATDPRDKVFALLGLAKDAIGWSPRADYSKSVERVYLETTRDVMARERDLSILEYASGGNSKTSLPSWVADWRREASIGRPQPIRRLSWLVRTFNLSPENSITVPYGHDVNACGGEKAIINNSEAGGGLCTRALIVDQILEIGDMGITEDNYEDIMAESSTLASKFQNPYPGGNDRSEALNQTRHGGFWFPNAVKDSPDESRLFSIQASSWEYRRFMVTKAEGYLGLVPTNSTAGDLICVIAGCAVPYIVRSLLGSYTLIGQAYG